MKHPMFYSIHKLSRSTISASDFNPYRIFFFSLSQELKTKSVPGGLTSLTFGCDDPTYNPSPVGKSSLLT